jgi:hypothetical protein
VTQILLVSCGRCGIEGPSTQISAGIERTEEGRYVEIVKCRDHAACESRRTATDTPARPPTARAESEDIAF